jgi:hypothetical protein
MHREQALFVDTAFGLTKDDLAGPVSMSFDFHDHLHILCLCIRPDLPRRAMGDSISVPAN